MGSKGVLRKNYYIYPETVAEFGTEIVSVMTETDRVMEEASEIIAEIASLTERVPSQIRSSELLELCETAQAEIRSFDFLSYGKRVNQGLQNLLDQNQYITENFIGKMRGNTERMCKFGAECRRLTELIDYSGGSLSLRGIALSAISNAEDVSNNAQKNSSTREELIREIAAKLSGASLNAYGEPIVNSADDAEKATAFYRYLEELTDPTREEHLQRLAARLSGVSLNAYGKPIVNSVDEAEKARVYCRYLEELDTLDREDLLRQVAEKLSGASLNAYGDAIVNSAEEAEKVTEYYQYLDELKRGEYSFAQVAAVLANVADSDMSPCITTLSDAIIFSDYLCLLQSVTYEYSLIEYIKEGESLQLEAYNNGKTIGYGFDINSHSNIQINYNGLNSITEAEAERLLYLVMEENEQYLDAYLETNGYEISQNAYYAALDLIYNRGLNDYTKEVILAMVNEDNSEVKNLLENFEVKFYCGINNATAEEAEAYLGNRSGLINRRRDEYYIYMYGFDIGGNIVCEE